MKLRVKALAAAPQSRAPTLPFTSNPTMLKHHPAFRGAPLLFVFLFLACGIFLLPLPSPFTTNIASSPCTHPCPHSSTLCCPTCTSMINSVKAKLLQSPATPHASMYVLTSSLCTAPDTTPHYSPSSTSHYQKYDPASYVLPVSKYPNAPHITSHFNPCHNLTLTLHPNVTADGTGLIYTPETFEELVNAGRFYPCVGSVEKGKLLGQGTYRSGEVIGR